MADLFEIAYFGIPLALLLLERPAFTVFGFHWKAGYISTIRNKLDSLWVFREGFSIYNLLSFFFVLGLWIFFLAPLPQLLAHGNILIEFYGSGHWLSWIGLISVITVFGYFDIIKGIYAAAFVYCIHELSWITAAGIYFDQLLTIYIHYAPIMILMAILLTSYFLAYRGLPKYKEALIIVVIVAFDILWMIAGLHVTVENWMPNPQTIYYSSPIVNTIEVLSWLLPALVAII